eukprot:NODE_305_length_2270_cov_10.230527_g237_i0.p1 GENE.NODE_305_length_2270_cov_10.230527_g237_i0~~NODE_305_length_2270_cov_10.230527_g237_i0.p1  ORF type:complete len:722 (+),score=178.24 NODE_305_length_2270_cov_10.230527_g237_i0:258-2168(+)
MDVFQRFSLAFGTLMFYILNTVMSISVSYYVLSILLFALSGSMTYHQLGLMDAVIAIPWLFQLGYVLAFPMIVELVIQRGLFQGLWEFIRSLPLSLFFFVFHLRTKQYNFLMGLIVGKGNYAATGRGFGLDHASLTETYKRYAASHFYAAFILLLSIGIYKHFSQDPALPFFLRTVTILLIIASWFFAPIVFNPMNRWVDLKNDIQEATQWLSATSHTGPPLEKMTTALELNFKEREKLAQEVGDLLAKDVTQAVNPGSPSATQAPNGSADGGILPDASPPVVPGDLKKNKQAKIAEINQKTVHCQDVMAKFWDKPAGKFNDELLPQTDGWWKWWTAALINRWQDEDGFFPGGFQNVLMVIQKVYIELESVFPWVLVALNFWALESVWYLVLIIVIVLFWWVLAKIALERWQLHHHAGRFKAMILLVIPTTVLFFASGTLSFSQLIWSLVFYGLCLHLALHSGFGLFNLSYKVKTRLPNPSSKYNFQKKTMNDIAQDKKKLERFRKRLNIPAFLAILHRPTPYCIFFCLAVVNGLCCFVNSFITSILYNVKVYASWERQLLKPDNPPPAKRDEPTQAFARGLPNLLPAKAKSSPEIPTPGTGPGPAPKTSLASHFSAQRGRPRRTVGAPDPAKPTR